MRYSFYGETNVGRVRDHNEDAFLTSEQGAFALVSDGMGGLAAGEVASQITKDSINAAFANSTPDLPLTNIVTNAITEANKEAEISIIDDIFQDMYRMYGGQIGHYLRNLYHIMSFIDVSNLQDDQKRFYMDLVQAQLSSSELFILFYDGISKYGREKLLPLLDKYKFLENLVYTDDYYFDKHKVIFYPNTIFKNYN